MPEIPVDKMIDNLLIKQVEGKVAGNVTGLAYHSAKVKKGNLFFALPGTRCHGWEYAGEAYENGALAIVVSDDAPQLGVPCIRVKDVRLAMALMANVFYDYPSRKLRLIGVTGTNGKTTTTYLINALLQNKGYVSGLLGTVNYKIDGEILSPLSTTPEASDLQELFDYMLHKNVTHAVMEVSSHALEWHRVSGCEFDVAVLTNITSDHLDFHRDFEAYLAAKAKLFSQMGGEFSKKGHPRVAVINKDDPHYAHITARVPVQQVSYAVKQPADVYAENPVIDLDGCRFTAKTFAGDINLELKLRGMFNIYNSLAAIAVGLAEGMQLEEIKQSLESVNGVPGRFEQVECGQDYLVVVDYAHTADSLENVLKTARELLNNGKLITVFGCGGDRDRGKRPLMGEIAGKYSDKCIITSDNPRTEDPEEIVRDILEGLEKEGAGGDYEIALKRDEAIGRAIKMAKKGDIVLIAGKGHEDYQIFKDKTISFSDRKVAAEYICQS